MKKETNECANEHKMTGIGFDTCPECEAPWKTPKDESPRRRIVNQIIDNAKLSSKVIFNPTKDESEWEEELDYILKSIQKYPVDLNIAQIELKDFVSRLLLKERQKGADMERNNFANEIIEAFGGILPVSGETAINPKLLAKDILALFFSRRY